MRNKAEKTRTLWKILFSDCGKLRPLTYCNIDSISIFSQVIILGKSKEHTVPGGQLQTRRADEI